VTLRDCAALKNSEDDRDTPNAAGFQPLVRYSQQFLTFAFDFNCRVVLRTCFLAYDSQMWS
jgi:hypothetical protein